MVEGFELLRTPAEEWIRGEVMTSWKFDEGTPDGKV